MSERFGCGFVFLFLRVFVGFFCDIVVLERRLENTSLFRYIFGFYEYSFFSRLRSGVSFGFLVVGFFYFVFLRFRLE